MTLWSRSSRPSRWLLAAPFLLGACATPPPEIEPAPVFVDTPGPATPATEMEPIPDPALDLAHDLVAQPERLLGLSPVDIRDILGPASLVRRDGSAQIVQFSSQTCVFDIYFYEPASGEAFAARHVAARDLSGASTAPIDCLETLLPDGYWPSEVDARLGLSPPPPDPELIPEPIPEPR